MHVVLGMQTDRLVCTWPMMTNDGDDGSMMMSDNGSAIQVMAMAVHEGDDGSMMMTMAV